MVLTEFPHFFHGLSSHLNTEKNAYISNDSFRVIFEPVIESLRSMNSKEQFAHELDITMAYVKFNSTCLSEEIF